MGHDLDWRAMTTPHVKRSLAMYTVGRLALLVFVFGVCLVAGLETPISIVIAFVVSSIASFLLLRGQRDERRARSVAHFRQTIGHRRDDFTGLSGSSTRDRMVQ